MANKGPFIQNFPCSLGDTIYKISHKTQKINKWIVFGFKLLNNEQGWVVIVRNNNNKYKYYEINIPFDSFENNTFLSKPEAEKALKEYSSPHEYLVAYKCGHTEKCVLYGDAKYRENRIKWLKSQLCPRCQNKKSERQGCTLVKMNYKDYKEKYAHCDTKVDSYDAENKTILVYLE